MKKLQVGSAKVTGSQLVMLPIAPSDTFVAEGISMKATLVMDYRPLHVPTLKIVFDGCWRDAGKV